MNLFEYIRGKEVKKNLKRSDAFTLVELLVAVTMFAVFIAVLTGSYLLLTKAQRDTNEMRKLYSDARFVMDEVIQDLRSSQIDYDCYTDASSECGLHTGITDYIETDVLAFVTDGGKRVVYKTEECSEECNGYALKKVVQTYEDFNLDTEFFPESGEWVPSNEDGYFVGEDPNGFQSLNLGSVSVEDLMFVITPSTSGSAVQPSVGIFMTLQGVSQLRENYEVEFDIQTTISLRNY